jgi:16S rRNA (cytosine967-C5)-methyltransferase
MTPAARLAAVIELLELLEGAAKPADQIVTAYLRQRRYIGSKDRRSINERIFSLLRHHHRLRWHLKAIGVSETPRALTLAHLLLAEGEDPQNIDTAFAAGGYGPASLSDLEHDCIKRLIGRRLDDEAMPDWAVSECPEWLWPRMQVGRFGRGRYQSPADRIFTLGS